MNRAQRRALTRQGGRRPGRRAAVLGSAAVLAGGAAAAVLAGGSPGGATTPIVVDSLADDGSGGTTLREAIQQANTGPGADTITFSVTGTITLQSDLTQITEGLHIQGPGAEVLTVDGDGAHQIFTFFGIATDEGDSSVSGLTLTGGYADSGAPYQEAGGAIVKAYEDGNLAISDCVITGNSADAGGGVALYDTRGNVTITNTVISDNDALGEGGGLAVSDNADGHLLRVLVTGSRITGNRANDLATSRGGAIWARHAVVDLVDTEVSGNVSARKGGGVWLYDVEASFTRVAIDDNEATGSTGGGLQGTFSTIAITESSVSGNVADAGGGGLYLGTATLVVSGSTIAGNEAGYYGGGLYLDVDSVSTTIVNSTISSNTAMGGSGVHARLSGGMTLELTQSTITGNSATAPSSDSAVGGITLSEMLLTDAVTGSKTIVGSIVAGNTGFDIGNPVGVPVAVAASGSVLGRVDDEFVTVVDGGGTQVGVAAAALHLGPLADNGGPTLTHALLPGSVAIDAGPVPPATFPGDAWDQRGEGYARVAAGRVDVGAFEVQPAREPVPEPAFTG